MTKTEIRECLGALMTMSLETLAGLSLAMLKLNYNDDISKIKEHIALQIKGETEGLN